MWSLVGHDFRNVSASKTWRTVCSGYSRDAWSLPLNHSTPPDIVAISAMSEASQFCMVLMEGYRHSSYIVVLEVEQEVQHDLSVWSSGYM